MLTRFLAPSLTTTAGGLLMGKGGRKILGRFAFPLGIGVMAYGLWRQYQASQNGAPPTTGDAVAATEDQPPAA